MTGQKASQPVIFMAVLVAVPGARAEDTQTSPSRAGDSVWSRLHRHILGDQWCVCACMRVCVCVQCATGQGFPMCRPQGRRSQGPTCLLVQPRTSPRLTYPCRGCDEGRAEDVLAQDHEDKKPVLRLGLGFWAVGSMFSRILEPA